MEREVDYGPPTKKSKPFHVLESVGDAWNIVDPDNLNAELPDELKNISLAQSNPMQRKNTLMAASINENFLRKCDFTLSSAVKMDDFDNTFRSELQKDFFVSKLHENDEFFSHDNYISAESVQQGSHQPFQHSLQIQHVSNSQLQQNQQLIQLQLQVIQDQHVQLQQSNLNQQKPSSTESIYQKYHIVSELQPPAMVRKQPSSQLIVTKPTLAIAPQKDSTISGLIQRRRLIQKQLVLLLHANKCQKKAAKSDGSDLFACNIPYCEIMKEVLRHLVTCQQEKTCKAPYCASSRQLINHWKDCSSAQCVVCSPLKLACEKKSTSALMAASVSATTETDSVFNSFSTLSYVQHHHMPSCSKLLASQLNVQEDMRNREGNVVKPASEVRPNSALPLDNNDWHTEVGREPRNNAVYKLVKFLRPACEMVGVNDLTRIILFVKQLEKSFYEKATSKNQYCQMLSTRIYAIKKKLEEPSFTGSLESLCVFNDSYDANQIILPYIIENQLTSISSHQNSETYSNDLKTSTLEISSSIVVPTDQNNVLHSNIQTIKGEMDVASSSDVIPLSSYKLVWKEDEIKKLFFPLLQELYHLEPESFPFRKPVDPELEGVPDYLNVIKKPMDLSTMQEKLNRGLYQEPWQLIDDVWLMFENAWTFNKKGSRVHRYCSKIGSLNLAGVTSVTLLSKEFTRIAKRVGAYKWLPSASSFLAFEQDLSWKRHVKEKTNGKKIEKIHQMDELSEVFDSRVDELMRNLGFCCGHKRMYTPIVLICYGKYMCTVPINSIYYTYQNKFSYCEKCFNNITGDYIELNEDPSQPATKLSKSYFVKCKNGEFEYEQLTECIYCGRRQHAICCLHMEQIWPNNFICHTCIANQRLEKLENKYTANRLPQTKLSIYLESRVNSFLKNNNISLGLITIRVLSSFEKSVYVKPGMKSRYLVESKNISSGFPYVAKGIFAFMESDGVDVCFFGMHVQEYDSSCSAPNSRRVYLAYMDSVNFFRPRHLRTSVYQELLIGYLDYVKKMGYAHAHIWACPPNEGDDYIFNCHPPDMKIPKQRRLQDWYRKMLDKAQSENVIFEYKDFYKDAIDNGFKSVTDMPYFEGDYWPSILEEIIKEAEEEEEEEEEENKIHNECNADLLDIDNNAIQNPCTPVSMQCHSKKKNQKGNNPRKTNCKSRFVRKAIKKSNSEYSDLASRLLTSIERLKDGFFVVNFHPPQMRGMLPEIKDPDQFINYDLMDGRDSFLSLARDKHYEFSSLRRAKYSTMALLYELHTQGKDGFVCTCNICKKAMEGHYHCYICNDFDLCESCYKKEGHFHEMGKLGGPDDGKEHLKEAKTIAIQNRIIALNHASQCLDANCEQVNCKKMKLSMQHVKNCQQKVENNCKGCRHFFALCCYHAKRCLEVKCTFILCKAIKQKHVLHRRLQAQMLRHRMAALHSSYEFPSVPDGNSGCIGLSIGREVDKSDKVRFVEQNGENVMSSLQQQEHSISNPIDSNITAHSFGMTTASVASMLHNKDDIVRQQFHFQNYSVPFIRNYQVLPSSSVTQKTLHLHNSNVNQSSLTVDLNLFTNNHNALLTSSSQPAFIFRLQPQLSLLTSPQGHVLGVLQHSQVTHKAGQQLVLQQSFNAPQQLLIAPQLASNLAETSVNLSNISESLSSSNIPNTAQSNLSALQLLLQSNSSNETQLAEAPSLADQPQTCNSMSSFFNSTAAVPKTSSAIVKLFETLKSSPLPQHQQLLNIFIKDPLKLAQVIKQKRAARELSNTKMNEQLQYSACATKPVSSSTLASGSKVLMATDLPSNLFFSSENPTQTIKQPIIINSNNSLIMNNGSYSHVTTLNSDRPVSLESIMRIGSRNLKDNKASWLNSNSMLMNNNTAVNNVNQQKLNETTLSQEHTLSSSIPGISQSCAPALNGSSDKVLTSSITVDRVLPSRTISNVNHLAPVQHSFSSDFQRFSYTNSYRSIDIVPEEVYHVSNQDLLRGSQTLSKFVLASHDLKFIGSSSPRVSNLDVVRGVSAETSSQIELSSSTFHGDILSKLVGENLNATAVKNIMLSSPAAQVGYPSLLDLTSLDQKDLIENVLDISPQDQLSQYADQL